MNIAKNKDGNRRPIHKNIFLHDEITPFFAGLPCFVVDRRDRKFVDRKIDVYQMSTTAFGAILVGKGKRKNDENP